MFVDKAKNEGADIATIIKVTYVDRESNAPAGTMTFQGKDLSEAMAHAASFRAAHNVLQDVACEVVRGSLEN